MDLGSFVALFGAFYIAAVIADTVSQLTYYGKSVAQVRSELKRTLMRMLVATTVVMLSILVWNYMGWKNGQPIRLPWRSG